MKSVSITLVLGNVGAAPEIRVTSNQRTMATFSLATGETWTDKDTKEKVERTEWHRIVAYGNLAEIVRDYIKQGYLLHVKGQNRTRKYQIEGEKKPRYMTEIEADEITILTPKPNGETEETILAQELESV